MLKRVLMFDKDRDAVRMIRACLIPIAPDAKVEHYPPSERGLPGPDFGLGEYDLLLLNYQLGLPEETGLDWLQALAKREDCPPAVFVTSEGNEKVAVRALKFGAVDYLTHEELTPERLYESIEEVERAAGEKHGADTAAAEPVEPVTTQISGTQVDARTLAQDEDIVFEAEEPPPPPGVDRRRPGRAPDLSPVQVPGYRMLKPLDDGGMAKVFLAERRRDKRVVVFKVLRIDDESDPRMRRRFMREYEILKQVRHRNVVRIYMRALADDYACLAMEYCGGGDLSVRIQGGLKPPIAIAYLKAVARGLGAAHAHGVVHRDMKPANVLFRDDGTLAVTDFGASARIGESRLTRASEIVGTPYYLSPEQIRGQEGTLHSDLYGTGIMFYEMLMGERPYRSKRLSEILDMHLKAPIPQLAPSLKRVQPVLDKLLAKEAAHRYESANELLAALDAL